MPSIHKNLYLISCSRKKKFYANLCLIIYYCRTSILFLFILISFCEKQTTLSHPPVLLSLPRDRHVYFTPWFPLLENLLLSKIYKPLCRENMPAIDLSCLERNAVMLPREECKKTSFVSSEGWLILHLV